jgi:competence protein ComEA
MQSEHRAILLLLALAVGGHAARLLLERPGEAPGQIALRGPGVGAAGSALAQRDSTRRQAQPLGEAERIDLDRAPAAELARLPRVGPSLARAIVADRTAKGPFGSLEGLDRVPGVGPGLLRQVEPHVRFSGAPGRPTGPPGGARKRLNDMSVNELDELQGVGKARAEAIVRHRAEHGAFRSAAELARVPGLGRKLAERLWETAGSLP